MPGTLYVVATPIGNIGDITERARRVLSEVDLIAAEDTRSARVLLNLLGLRNRILPNHKFNESRQAETLLHELENGKNVALVSDAGTPCISDPGEILVAGAALRGIPVVGVCGASAVMTALSVCGFRFRSFVFYGFLPRGGHEIARLIRTAAGAADVSVFFESPRRILRTIGLLTSLTPGAALCLCNDLTKYYERAYRGTPDQILAALEENPSSEKGEYTLVAQFGPRPPSEAENAPNAAGTRLSPEAVIADHIAKDGGTVRAAVTALAGQDYSKKELYAAAIRLKSILRGETDGA